MAKITITAPTSLAEALRSLPEGGVSNVIKAGITAALVSQNVKNAVGDSVNRTDAPRTTEEKMAYALKTFVEFHRSKLEADEDVSHLSREDAQVYHTLAIAFEFSIRDLMRGTEPFTKGSEAEVFRVRAGDSEFVIVKRRYDSVSGSKGVDNEYRLQTLARNVAKKTDGVRVPKIFHRIHGDDGAEYIVMEYVKGKTLWNLMLESLANPGMSVQGSLSLQDVNPVQRFFHSRAQFDKNFDNDTDAESDMIERYRAHGEKIGSPYDLGMKVVDPISRQVTYPHLKPYLDADLKKLSMFDAETVAYVEKKLRKFLGDLHNEGIYHRDLNIRNVMLTPDGDLYVIDFGKGVKSVPNDSSVYDAEEGKYDSDFSIIEQFKQHGPKAETDADRIKKAAETSRKGISEERVAKAARQMGLDSVAVAETVSRISQKFGAKYFENLFKQYVDGTAERYHPDSFIRANPRKADAVKGTETGKRQLLANLLLADREELETLLAYFDSIGAKLRASHSVPLYGSPVKDERAEKYLPIFEAAVIAAME